MSQHVSVANYFSCCRSSTTSSIVLPGVYVRVGGCGCQAVCHIKLKIDLVCVLYFWYLPILCPTSTFRFDSVFGLSCILICSCFRAVSPPSLAPNAQVCTSVVQLCFFGRRLTLMVLLFCLRYEGIFNVCIVTTKVLALFQ